MAGGQWLLLATDCFSDLCLGTCDRRTNGQTDWRLLLSIIHNSYLLFTSYHSARISVKSSKWSNGTNKYQPSDGRSSSLSSGSEKEVWYTFLVNYFGNFYVVFIFCCFLYFYFDVIILSCFAFITATHDIPIHININTLEKMQLNSIDIQKQGVNDIPIWYLRNRSKDFVIFSSISV